MASAPPPRPTTHAFIDESGQRAFTPTSSDYFVMSAVIVQDVDVPAAAAFLAELRRELNRRPGDTLHFKNLHTHEERVHVSKRIGAIGFLTVSTVVICKRRFNPERHGWTTDEATYSKTVELLLERLSWFARDECGIWNPPRDPFSRGGWRPGVMSYTLAHIVRYTTAHLRQLEAQLRTRAETDIAWKHLDPRGGRLDQTSRVELLQLADLAVSATAKAFEPDRFGNTNRVYLEALASRLYRRRTGNLSSYGLKVYPSCDEQLAWVNRL